MHCVSVLPDRRLCDKPISSLYHIFDQMFESFHRDYSNCGQNRIWWRINTSSIDWSLFFCILSETREWRWYLTCLFFCSGALRAYYSVLETAVLCCSVKYHLHACNWNLKVSNRILFPDYVVQLSGNLFRLQYCWNIFHTLQKQSTNKRPRIALSLQNCQYTSVSDI